MPSGSDVRLKLTIEYVGTRYSGWQIQKNARTVQGELERAIRQAVGETDRQASTGRSGRIATRPGVRALELYGSGRTDAGVHALAQVAHLDIEGTLPPETLKRRINDALPADINILRIERVRHRFHARRDASARSYVYQISRRRTAFGKPYVWWVKDELDVAAMRGAAARFVGMHDFQSFTDDDPDEKSTQVLLEALDVHEDGDLILIHIEGSHFLWKMVRRLVGVLVEVGRGGQTVDEAAAMLTARSHVPARLTAPASGLFLERVYYPGDPRDRVPGVAKVPAVRSRTFGP
jgi:tRNA pseudouridine38-40 synthase